MRKEKFQTGEYYHVYNRGVDKRDIFVDDKDFVRFLKSMRELNDSLGDVQRDYIKRHGNSKNSKSDFGYPKSDFLPLVEIVSFCLNQNHYHFILKQLVDGSITLFMRKLATGYTKYFNIKHNRSGVLFQGKFKAIHIKDYGHLLKLMVYANCNYEIHNLGKAEDWIWSSYLDVIGKRNGTLCNFDIIKEEFKKLESFKNFCAEIIPEVKMNKELREYLLE